MIQVISRAACTAFSTPFTVSIIVAVLCLSVIVTPALASDLLPEAPPLSTQNSTRATTIGLPGAPTAELTAGAEVNGSWYPTHDDDFSSPDRALVDHIQRDLETRLDTSPGQPRLAPPSYRSDGLPSKGTARVLVFLVDFSDADNLAAQTTADVANKMFGDGDPGRAPIDSLRNYYQRSSYGQLLITGSVHGWYRSSLSRAEYEQKAVAYDSQYGKGEGARRAFLDLVREVTVAYADQIDYTQYDANDDHKLDAVYIKFAGPCNSTSIWWGAAYKSPVEDVWIGDGMKIGRYTVSGYSREGADPDYPLYYPRTDIHETGHLLGLPDYYDSNPYAGPSGGAGGWDMMDAASWGDHGAFSKYLLGWLSPTLIDGSGQVVDLAPSSTHGEAVIIMPRASLDEYVEFFLAEYRQPGSGNVPDGLPIIDVPVDAASAPYTQKGLFLWHVDARLNARGDDFKYNNSAGDHKLLRLMEADGQEHLEHPVSKYDGYFDQNDIYVPGTSLGPTTVPDTTDYPGHATGVTISQIEFTGAGARADFRIGDQADLTVRSITPNSGRRATTVAISALVGTGFSPRDTVRLERPGEPRIEATSVVVSTPNRTVCSISIPSTAALGWWDVVVANAYGETARLPAAFEIRNSPAEAGVRQLTITGTYSRSEVGTLWPQWNEYAQATFQGTFDLPYTATGWFSNRLSNPDWVGSGQGLLSNFLTDHRYWTYALAPEFRVEAFEANRSDPAGNGNISGWIYLDDVHSETIITWWPSDSIDFKIPLDKNHGHFSHSSTYTDPMDITKTLVWDIEFSLTPGPFSVIAIAPAGAVTDTDTALNITASGLTSNTKVRLHNGVNPDIVPLDDRYPYPAWPIAIDEANETRRSHYPISVKGIPVGTVYDLIITQADGRSQTLKNAFRVLPTPVLLVHGLRDSNQTWGPLRDRLQQEGFDVWVFEEPGMNSADLRTVAGHLYEFLNTTSHEYRPDAYPPPGRYEGKYDIVAHSSGALVSRYFFEKYLRGGFGGGVRQWIGIAPMHNGSALMDVSTDLPWWGSLVTGGVSGKALTQLRTNSTIYNYLNPFLSTTKYRVIAGWNPTHSQDFGSGILSMTLAKGPDASGGGYFWTHSGDMLVATAQSRQPGMEFDAFPLGGDLKGAPPDEFDHVHITRSPQVIDAVVSYLKDINRPSSNIIPPEDRVPFEYRVTQVNNTGSAGPNATSVLLHVAAGVSADDALIVQLSWESGDLDIDLTSPSGAKMTGSVHPGTVHYTKEGQMVSYIVMSPETGDWWARITQPNYTGRQIAYNLTYFVRTTTSAGTPTPTQTSIVPQALPGQSSIPRDPNGDGKYEDVNGNGRPDFADVVLYFNQMGWIAANEPVGLFDYNANGRIDFADVVWLFNHL